MATTAPQIASGPGAELGYQEEVSYGLVPADIALKVARIRSHSLALTKEAYASEEKRRDRMTSDMRHGIRRADGDIVTELSPGSHADWYEALLGGFWRRLASINVATGSTPVTVTDLGDGTLNFAGPDFTALGYRIGDNLTFAGANAALNGFVFTLLSATGTNGKFLPPKGFSGALPITTTTGTLAMKGGRLAMGNVLRSFLFEDAYSDIGSFRLFKGERFNSAAIDLPATGIATATFGMMGQDASALNSASVDGVAELTLDQTALGTLTLDAAAGTITAANAAFGPVNVGDRIALDGAGITDAQNRNVRTVIAKTSTVLTVAEALESAVYSTGNYTITRVGLPAYTAPSDEAVLVAVSGAVLVNGVPAGTITSLTLNIDNGMGGSTVVGKNIVPTQLFGNRCTVSGSFSVLFDRGGVGQTIYNAFDLEQDVSLLVRLDKADGTQAMTFSMPRIKVGSGSIGNTEAEGLPVSVDFTALRPLAANVIQGASQIVIGDTAVTDAVVA